MVVNIVEKHRPLLTCSGSGLKKLGLLRLIVCSEFNSPV